MTSRPFIPPIPLSNTDTILGKRGFSLLDEYTEIIRVARFELSSPVLELATGPGRSAAVLTRLGHRVITGDISLDKREDVRRRLTARFESMVTTLRLDMVRLPFRNASVASILCVNTIHELDDAESALRELIRVHAIGGTLVVSDFSDDGFDIMDAVHLEVYGHEHDRGKTTLSELLPMLRRFYRTLRRVDTPLNVSWVCSGRQAG